MIHPPGRLSGNNPLATWLNKLREFVIYTAPQGIQGGRMTQDSRGTFFEIPPSSGGSSLTRLRLHSVSDDYLSCHTWTDDDSATDTIFVAKPKMLRTTAWNRTVVDSSGTSVTHTYTFSGTAPNKIRNDDWTTTNHDQEVRPEWAVGEEIWAMSATTGVTTSEADGSVAVNLLYVLPSRQWAKV